MLYKDNQNNPQRVTTEYKAILKRLEKTVDFYATTFPEIASLKQEMGLIYFNIFLSDAHLNHLQKICKLLNKKKEESSTINMLHEAFCEDITLFQRGATINQTNEIYF